MESNITRFEVEFYEDKDGNQPVKEFLSSLDKKMRAKMITTISILQDNGYELREPYSKHLSEGIFELRAKVGSDITRVLYFFFNRQTDHSYKRIYKENSEDTDQGKCKGERIQSGLSLGRR